MPVRPGPSSQPGEVRRDHGMCETESGGVRVGQFDLYFTQLGVEYYFYYSAAQATGGYRYRSGRGRGPPSG